MIIYFCGPCLDSDDADAVSSNETDYLDRHAAPPPVVIRGFDRSGNPLSIIRAGARIDDAVETAASALTAYGFDPASVSAYWVFPAFDVYGNAITAYARFYFTPTSQILPPPFSFRPNAVIPMPNGHLFCLAAPLDRTYNLALGTITSYQYAGYFREYFRVYRRNGDQVQDFPDLHGGPIHDAYWDGSGNCYIAGDEVGAEKYSFRKYDSAYSLQWSLSFNAYWPISTVAVRTSNTHYTTGRAQFDQRRAAVKIEPAPDGALYVISEIAVTHGYVSGSFTYHSRRKAFFMIAKVSTAGALTWIRVLECPSTVTGEPDRRRFSCKAVNDKVVVCLRDGLPFRYSVGESGGDYSWNEYLEVYKTDAQWTYQELYDYFYEDRIDELNGLVLDDDGDFIDHLFPSSSVVVQSVMLSQGVLVETKIYPESFGNCLLHYIDAHLRVLSKRNRWSGTYEEYNVDPQYVRHVFDADLTPVSDDEIDAFTPTDAIAVDESNAVYYGRRVTVEHGPVTLASIGRTIYCANHFQAFNAAGSAIWSGLAASATLGFNSYGKTWRDYGLSRTNTPFNSTPAGSTQAEWQAAHDGTAAYTTAHGATASGDLVSIKALSGSTVVADFWRAATDIAIVYNSLTPSLDLPVFLKTPSFAGEAITFPPGLALAFAPRAPFFRQEYVGIPLPSIYRLTVGGALWPFSWLRVRKTILEITVSVVCPAVSEPMIQAMASLTNATFTVSSGVRFMDGTEQLAVLLTAPISTARYDRGGGSWSITLKSRYAPPIAPVRPRAIVKVSRSQTRTGMRIWTGALDLFLNPGDTLHWGEDSLVAGIVEYRVKPSDAQMIVTEAVT